MGRASTRPDGLAALELVIVVTVLVLLTGVLVPSIDRAVRANQRSEAHATMQRLAGGVLAYKHHTGQWPACRTQEAIGTSVEVAGAFTCLNDNTRDLPGWHGPYVNAPDATLLDPWGQPWLVYTFAEDFCHSGGGIALLSGGPNRRVDTAPASILAGCPTQDDLVQLVIAHL